MNYKIEKSFQNSQFYRNYNNIENVILHFDKIKNEYTLSKDKYKNSIISLMKILNEKQTRSNFLKKMNIKLIEKYENKLDDVLKNEFNIDKNLSDSCRIILHKKISISHNIKKYVKFSKNTNEDFIMSVEIGNIIHLDFPSRSRPCF